MKIVHTLNLKKIDVNAIDFERLTESQMQFKGQNWERQVERFDQELDFNHEYIFWVENYASLILATHYLDSVNHPYAISYDSAVEMWCFTTDYASTWNK